MLLLVLCLLLHPALARAMSDDSPTWVALGDSLTSFTTFAPPEGSWHDIVAHATGATIINRGLGGDTTERAVGRVYRDAIWHKPSLVIVGFGINDQQIPNDSFANAFRVPQQQFLSNLDQIVSKIEQSGIQVLLLTNRPLIEGPSGDDRALYFDKNADGGSLYQVAGKTKQTIRVYNDIIRFVAKEHGIEVADIWQAVVARGGGSDSDQAVVKAGIDRPGKFNDGVHLGPAGHRLMADTILKAIEGMGIPVHREAEQTP